MVAAALIRLGPTFGPAFLAVSGASQIVLYSFYWVDDKYVAESYLYLLLSIFILYVYARPFSMERLRAWIQNKREPRAPDALRTLDLTP